MSAKALQIVTALAALAGSALAPSGAASGRALAAEAEAPAPVYRGVETRMIDPELVSLRVTLEGGEEDDLVAYATCAAAQYALIRGYGFARHVRTTVEQDGEIWRADAVYTVSPALPRGLRTIDAEVTVADCADRGIPTI
jgi:hypothetical protein